MGEEQLKHAFVTSCQLESFFAVIDDVNRASNKIKIAENRGQAMVRHPPPTRLTVPSLVYCFVVYANAILFTLQAIKSHTFLTAEERLRQEIFRRQKTHEDEMTPEGAEAFLALEPLAGWCTLTEEENHYLYVNCEKNWYYEGRTVAKNEIDVQNKTRLKRKRDGMEAKELSDMAKRTQFASFENEPIYHSMAELNEVLHSKYPAVQDVPERPRYSPAMKTMIVRGQLNARKWVYAIPFKPGFLLSSDRDSNPHKLKSLLKLLEGCFLREQTTPLKKVPPLIRHSYALGPNDTKYRQTPDAERN
jgi:hypothetical protein